MSRPQLVPTTPSSPPHMVEPTAPVAGAELYRRAATEATIRSTVAVGLGSLIVIHAVDGVAKWTETPYIFWMYMAAIAASLVCGAALLFGRTPRTVRLALPAAAGIAGSVFLGYVVNRTVGMPNATDDIGNWTEPLGLASIVSEGITVVAALAGWRALRDPR